MNHFAARVVFAIIVLSLSKADVYLHNPGGSNNRLNERSAARANANRLFDSQNNNRGGYNVGDKTNKKATKTTEQYNMTFFQSGEGGKSFLTFEWTNQHGSGGSDDTNPHKMNGNIVLQYMCQPVPGQSISASLDHLRNGLSRNTQDYKATNKKSDETQNDYEGRKGRDVKSDRGLHESWEWYDKCRRRERNKGLFVADQKLAGEESIYTRQNPSGTRRGYECPEERDYYPYWHPTDWKDIAVLTNNLARCDYYKKHSFNVEPKGECVERYPNKKQKHWSQYNNARNCEENGGKWAAFTNFLEKFPLWKYRSEEKCLEAGEQYIWGIPHGFASPQCLVKLDAPFCGVAPWTRDNHLGNTPVGEAPNFRWEIPRFPSGQDHLCVFRIRYNISTEDYDGWNTNGSKNNQLIQQNPTVDIGATTPLRLAINTAQYGRTFQDRTHLIQLNHRLTHGVPEDANVFNLNVRGKRGNIVQVYPAVEYDFIPNKLSINKDTDLVHIQWTGSNTHNNGNPAGDGQAGDAGEGNSDGTGFLKALTASKLASTDRNNLVQTRDPLDNYPLPWEKSDLFKNATAVWTSHDYKNPIPEDIAVSFASAGFYSCLHTVRKWCETESVEDKASRMDSLLNNAPASYGGMLLKFKKKGCFHYICSRNNNFSNRSQKGTLCVN